MQRSTKIVATLGPASSSPERLAQLVAAGVDVVRLNFSHGTPEDHQKRVDALRHCKRFFDRNSRRHSHVQHFDIALSVNFPGKAGEFRAIRAKQNHRWIALDLELRA